jgi:hypothetical protein
MSKTFVMAQIEQSWSTNLYGSLLADLLRMGNEVQEASRCQTPVASPTDLEPPVRHVLVARLRQQIAADTYQPDPMQIAQAMLGGSLRIGTETGH